MKLTKIESLTGKLLCQSVELNLTLTLLGGQSFRWKQIHQTENNKIVETKCVNQHMDTKPRGDYFQGVFSECLWDLWQDDTYLYYEMFTHQKLSHKEIESMLRKYFRLEENLVNLYQEWSKRDDFFKRTCSDFVGIRMINQNLVENIFSFLCSSNNNIARISGMIDKMCIHYGDLIGDVDNSKYYSFPGIEQLAKPNVEPKLRELGFGYRAKFIQKSAEYIEQNGGEVWLDKLKKMNYEDARNELQNLPGIGAKVADCICLMSLSHLESVPVDTHVYQIACNHYQYEKKSLKTLTPTVYNEIRIFFINKFGPYAGWAHSILFCADLKKFQEKKPKVEKKVKKSKLENDQVAKKKIKVERNEKEIDVPKIELDEPKMEVMDIPKIKLEVEDETVNVENEPTTRRSGRRRK